MTYYLKYRSKTINELDLKDVRESLLNIVKSEKIPHAFLFSGPKGSGKTSAARILARIVNCERPDKSGEPCNKCDSCKSIIKGESLDVIEIDAASHRGIDDIRAIREAVKLSPIRAKKKVYIIDEAHMLTTEASNALLKILEEPPSHVIFILATTNPEKLIETIRSRTVNVSFSKAKIDEIVRSLSRVVSGEKLKTGNHVLDVVASASDGSFRDAMKLLEELVINNITLEKETVEEYLFKKKEFDPVDFIEFLTEGDEINAYLSVEKAIDTGASAKNITSSILDYLREILLAKVGLVGKDCSELSKTEILELIRLFSRSYSEVNYAVLEQIPLELAISEWCAKKTDSMNGPNNGKYAGNGPKDSKILKDRNASENKVKGVVKKTNPLSNGTLTLNGFEADIWTKLLAEIKLKNSSTEALLRAAKPLEYKGKTLTLGVYYKFHKEKLETNQHRNILENVLQSIVGESIRVVCTLTEPPLKSDREKELIVPGGSEAVLIEGEDDDVVKVAKEIFGS